MRHICAILSTPSRLRKALKTKTSYPLADHSAVSRISCPLGGEGSAFLSFFAGGHYWPYTEVCKFVISYISTRIACYNGLIVQAAINNLLPLFYVIIQRDFNVSVEKLGMLTAVNFVTQLLVDLFAAAFVDRLGWRRSICLSHILAVAGFAALSFLPGMIDPYMAVVISVIVYASGSAIIEVMVSPIVEALPSTDKGGQMALPALLLLLGTACCRTVVHSRAGCFRRMAVEIPSAVLGNRSYREFFLVFENTARYPRPCAGEEAARQ